MSAEDRPLLALTLGDTAGVGPEIVLKALADPEVRAAARTLVVGDAGVLRARAKRLGLEYDLRAVDSAEELRAGEIERGILRGSGGRGAEEGVTGRVDADAGRASVTWVKEAARLATAGEVDGMVTAPINKLAVKRAGFDYEGHTELLGEITNAEPVMMLVGGGLRVAIVTRHCALREVPGLLAQDEIVRTARVVAGSLERDFGIARNTTTSDRDGQDVQDGGRQTSCPSCESCSVVVAGPRVGILALNPHASDGGRFGDEEERVIAPAIEELRASGVDAIGPLVPDVAFWRALRGGYDALVAMYHDQGLIPLKTVAFDRGVNVTLGLPIVRTSPDHGTAFDIAGKGMASHVSFVEAVKLCAVMAANRKKERP